MLSLMTRARRRHSTAFCSYSDIGMPPPPQYTDQQRPNRANRVLAKFGRQAKGRASRMSVLPRQRRLLVVLRRVLRSRPTSPCRARMSHRACGYSELWGDFGSYELCGIARCRFRLSTDMPPVVASGGIAGGSHEHQRILVPLPGSASHTGEIEMALSAAKALGAHVQALFISQPPPVTRGGLSVSELGRTATAASVNWHAEELERTARDAREVFAQACAAVGIPMLSANDEPGSPLEHPGAKPRDRMWKSRCNGPLPST